MSKRIREKKHRLPRDLYVGRKVVAFTACLREKKEIFINRERFLECERILKDELRKNNSEALVYLFMPDHCHLLLSGKSDTADAINAVIAFKQRTGYWLPKKFRDVRWQRDFYDHVLRDPDEVEVQVKYILANPVRKHIVEDWKDYEFKGSTVYDFEE